MSGPVKRTYKAGSIIYFEGDRGEKGDEVYVLQEGKIRLISTGLDLVTENKEDVKRGEFFGVKSAMGHYPREETAQVIADSTVLVFKTPLFEAFSLKNPRLVLQMLKVFSSQLRKIHRKVRETLGEYDITDTSIELMKVAEYYYKIGNKKHAEYAYNAYLKQYPDGDLEKRARTMINNIDQGQDFPVNSPSLEAILSGQDYAENIEDISEDFSENLSGEPMDDMGASGFETTSDDFSGGSSLDDFAAPPLEGSNDFGTPMASDDFGFSDPSFESGNSDFGSPSDDFSLGNSSFDEDFGSSSMNTSGSASELYYEGLNQFSQNNFDKAIEKFNLVLGIKNFANQEEAGFLEKAQFEKGRAYLKKNAMNESIQEFSEYLKKYPSGENKKKTLNYMAEIYEKKGDKQKAVLFYNKVILIKPLDKITNSAKQKLERLGG
ncbi:MAG: cyclic nucleotide-binding domain-containing protein [Spirochaetia bacterium]|nr:cyclic nucleotide-binding domain-containing protein [Spirochaetia bacterium]